MKKNTSGVTVGTYGNFNHYLYVYSNNSSG